VPDGEVPVAFHFPTGSVLYASDDGGCRSC
jgi:hypothetical protein